MRRPTGPGPAVIPPTAPPQPGSVEVALSHVAVDAELTNLSPQTTSGVRTHWRAWSAEGRYLGGHVTSQLHLPPGGTHPYVGGAGADLLNGAMARLEIGIGSSPRVGTGPAIGSRHLQLESDGADWCIALADFATTSLPQPSAVPLASLVLRCPEGRVRQADFTAEVLPSRRRPGLWQAHFDLFDGPLSAVSGESWLWWGNPQ